MPQQQEERRDYVFVRRKQTRQIDIRRANELSPRRDAHPKTHEHPIHYVDLTREQICRCNDPKRHGSKVFSVASESTHLSASFALYMSRHNLESCTTKSFQKYNRRRETEWAKEGVLVNSFHYGNHEKNVVCRCNKPNDHGCGAPRNPEIIEQCADYFCLHKDRMSVSKKQWRHVDSDSSAEAKSSQKPKVELFKDSEDERTTVSRSKREMRKHSNEVMQQEPGIPSQVWEKARPSLWRRPNGASSTVTTPLGSPSFPSRNFHGPASAPLVSHIPASDVSRSNSVSTSWSQVQRNANIEDTRTGMKTAPIASSSQHYSDPFIYSTYLSKGMPSERELGQNSDASKATLETDFQIQSEHETNGCLGYRLSAEKQPRHQSNLDEYLLKPVAYDTYTKSNIQNEAIGKEMAPKVPVTELPAEIFTAELAGDTPRRQHTPTLRRLEGRNWDAISKFRPNAEKMNDQIETMSNRTSFLTQSFDLFNLLLKQIQSSPVSLTTDGSSHEYQKPLSGAETLSVCKETLADRINAQREAIFRSQITPLEDELRIEFPQRSEDILCTSQEDVFVAQLLLINDHVDTHAIEAIHLFETQGTEPDWPADVIQPAVMLLRGWNRSFADLVSYMHEAFLNLLSWAELLRLMKDAQVTWRAAQDEEVMLSWLEELHDRFFEAKEFYDKGKEKWRIDIFEPLSCDKVALYVVEKAMETREL